MLALQNVTKHYQTRRGTVRAVEGVSFEVRPKSTLALVGESGCGKTTIAKMILQLERPTAGAIAFEGADTATMNATALKQYRRQVMAVFQDPYASLNPRLRVGTIIAEPLLAHESPGRAAVDKRVAEVLDIVGLPATAARLYPHEFSGGQRQRIAIARALALRPRLMVLDEPVSALDVSVRNAVLNLLQDLQDRTGVAYLLISHDLAVVRAIARTVAIMEAGRIVEHGPVAEIFAHPGTETTRRLLAAVPRLSLA
jgi:ABC-type glutathione transport system ATPase component